MYLSNYANVVTLRLEYVFDNKRGTRSNDLLRRIPFGVDYIILFVSVVAAQKNLSRCHFGKMQN